MITSSTFDDESEAMQKPPSESALNSARSNRSNEEDDVSPSNSRNEFSKYLILELAENGDLFDYVISTRESMGEDLARHYFLQLLSALEYLHID